MKLLKIFKEDSHICVNILGIKSKFKNPCINRLRDCCCINDLEYLIEQGTEFIHPIGIVIIKGIKIGKNCKIFQNVTIGASTQGGTPVIGDNVTIFPNSVIYGEIEIGNNVIIGAGSIVNKSVPPNSVIAGNPATIIKKT